MLLVASNSVLTFQFFSSFEIQDIINHLFKLYSLIQMNNLLYPFLKNIWKFLNNADVHSLL